MEIAPLIDIVFLQMIFFMLTSAFVFQPGVKVHLPKAVTADLIREESLEITISKAGHLTLGSRVVTLQELRSRLGMGGGPKVSRSWAASLPKEQPLLIRADRQAPLGRVVEVWDLCRGLGISQVNIATSDE